MGPTILNIGYWKSNIPLCVILAGELVSVLVNENTPLYIPFLYSCLSFKFWANVERLYGEPVPLTSFNDPNSRWYLLLGLNVEST